MTFDKFTIKAQEAIQSALDTAKRNGQQTIEPVHILAGVMDKGKDVTDYVLQKLGVNAQTVELSLQNEIKHLPKVSGGEPYFSPDSNKVLEKTLDISQKLGDDYVSIEPLLLALLQVGSTASGHPVAAPRTEGGEPKRRRKLPGPLQVCHQPRGAGAGRKTRPSDRP